jgi:hypothetical protein
MLALSHLVHHARIVSGSVLAALNPPVTRGFLSIPQGKTGQPRAAYASAASIRLTGWLSESMGESTEEIPSNAEPGQHSRVFAFMLHPPACAKALNQGVDVRASPRCCTWPELYTTGVLTLTDAIPPRTFRDRNELENLIDAKEAGER